MSTPLRHPSVTISACLENDFTRDLDREMAKADALNKQIASIHYSTAFDSNGRIHRSALIIFLPAKSVPSRT